MAVQFISADTRGLNVIPLVNEDLYVLGHTGGDNTSEECSLKELDGVPIVLPLSAQGIRMFVERSFAQWSQGKE